MRDCPVRRPTSTVTITTHPRGLEPFGAKLGRACSAGATGCGRAGAGGFWAEPNVTSSSTERRCRPSETMRGECSCCPVVLEPPKQGPRVTCGEHPGGDAALTAGVRLSREECCLTMDRERPCGRHPIPRRVVPELLRAAVRQPPPRVRCAAGVCSLEEGSHAMQHRRCCLVQRMMAGTSSRPASRQGPPPSSPRSAGNARSSCERRTGLPDAHSTDAGGPVGHGRASAPRQLSVAWSRWG